ncbi:MAG: TIGR00725 family protein [Candidatus Natronoplasma sp.]
MYVSVIGGDVTSCTYEDCERAEKIGEGIADLGAVLVCGGRGGIMEAACRGAKRKGGKTIGILPSADRSEGNEYLDHAIVTGLGMVRNSLVVLNGDIVVAIDGRYGTLSEIALGIEYGKRILGLGTWDVEGVESYETVEDILEVLESFLR